MPEGSGTGQSEADSTYARVRRTLALAAQAMGRSEPDRDEVKRWLGPKRGLTRLLKEIEPEEAAALYAWCGRHFSGGKTYAQIHDHLGVFRRQMRKGVTLVPLTEPERSGAAQPSSRPSSSASPRSSGRARDAPASGRIDVRDLVMGAIALGSSSSPSSSPSGDHR